MRRGEEGAAGARGGEGAGTLGWGSTATLGPRASMSTLTDVTTFTLDDGTCTPPAGHASAIVWYHSPRMCPNCAPPRTAGMSGTAAAAKLEHARRGREDLVNMDAEYFVEVGGDEEARWHRGHYLGRRRVVNVRR